MTPLSVLYVDDDADIRFIVDLAFACDPAITLRCAATAAEALEILEGGWRPDVAMLDVMMPGVDGPTLLASLRHSANTATLPVIFVTARSRPGDVAAYKAGGAVGVIVKPFDPLTLAEDVRALLSAAADQGTITR